MYDNTFLLENTRIYTVIDGIGNAYITSVCEHKLIS